MSKTKLFLWSIYPFRYPKELQEVIYFSKKININYFIGDVDDRDNHLGLYILHTKPSEEELEKLKANHHVLKVYPVEGTQYWMTALYVDDTTMGLFLRGAYSQMYTKKYVELHLGPSALKRLELKMKSLSIPKEKIDGVIEERKYIFNILTNNQEYRREMMENLGVDELSEELAEKPDIDIEIFDKSKINEERISTTQNGLDT